MRRMLLALAVIFLVAGSLAAKDLEYLDKLPPMIDRETFFGDPEIAGGQISPDGKFISFLRPYKEVLNIWVKSYDEPFDAARPVTSDTIRPVRGYAWTRDGRYVIYVQDKGGDENFHLYAVDPFLKLEAGQDVPPARDLTPIEGIRAFFYSLPKKDPNIIYIGLNDRDERYHDVYRLNIATGERTLIRQNNEEVAGWVFDLEGNLRLATRQTEDGGTEIFRIDGDEMTSIHTCTNEETAVPYRFHKDGKRFYMITNKGEDIDLTRLTLFDPKTLKEEFVESDPKKQADFGGALFSEVTEEIMATFYVADRLRIEFKDKKFEKAYKKLKKQLPEGDIYLGSSTSDDRLWLVSVTSDTDPGATYTYDMETDKVEFLYRPRPKLPVEHLAPMKTVRYKARDGLEIPAYLTVPKGVKAKNLAVVMLPHGGPWARDYWGYDPYAQFLANRGYAVLQPNFRGSRGYGKAFLNAGKRQWGEAMQDDITDGVNYLIDKGIADPKKVAIFGGSYGGYATLAGVAFTPDLYCAGVDYVGVSNLLTFLNSIPPYWETFRNYLKEQVGDPDNPEDLERLKRQSPLFSADKIKAPLLVVQGANDPRVKKAESDQIVVAMRDLGRDVEYLIAPDEGHGFSGVENRMAFITAMEKFLSTHVGGRYQESISEKVKERLDEITINVSTVTLEKPAADPEKAKTAPLPACDVSMLKPMTLKYKANAAVMGQEIPMDMDITIGKATFNEMPIWRIISEQKSAMGAGVDTFDVDVKTLIPVRRSATQGMATFALTYSKDAIKGGIKMGAQEMPVDVALPAPVFGDASALEVAITTLPLASGYETTLRTFAIATRTVRPMLLTVIGKETVTVPAGTFEAFKIELKPLDGDPGGGTYLVSEKDPRCVVHATVNLPAQAGGGTITAELVSLE